MSNHIPDAGKMVCPKCGCGAALDQPLETRYSCNSYNCHPSKDVVWLQESGACIRIQRDQLRARVEDLESQLEATVWKYTPAMAEAKIQQLNKRVEELEGWCERMANMLEEEGWESTAQNEFKKYMEAKPKPEGLR